MLKKNSPQHLSSNPDDERVAAHLSPENKYFGGEYIVPVPVPVLRCKKEILAVVTVVFAIVQQYHSSKKKKTK